MAGRGVKLKNTANGIPEKALQVVDKIVNDMPEKEKERIFHEMSVNKETRDHILKMFLWTYCKKDILKDVKKREHIKEVVAKLEKKRARKLKHKRAMEYLMGDEEGNNSEQ